MGTLTVDTLSYSSKISIRVIEYRIRVSPIQDSASSTSADGLTLLLLHYCYYY